MWKLNNKILAYVMLTPRFHKHIVPFVPFCGWLKIVRQDVREVGEVDVAAGDDADDFAGAGVS